MREPFRTNTWRGFGMDLAVLALVWSLSGSVRAGEGPVPQVRGKLDAKSVGQWADETFGRILAEHRVSALAISVTQGDVVVFKKGYGYADWAARTPVNSDTSQFRIASLSKTFIGTAIAQLFERHRIASLDDPVNKYLKRVQLKSFAGKDVTIWDMMTHQGGLGPSPVFANDQPPLPEPPLPAEYIASKMPDVVREPGTFSIYCNPCIATLGFMIEDITGQTLQQYLKENVFDPLGMSHTAVVTEWNPQSKDIVVQYVFTPNGVPTALPYPNITPFLAYAGAINSTAGDMSRYLIAHIQEGAGSGPKLMSPATFKLMHTRHRGNEPNTSGFGMQFFTYDYNGEHVLEHYGSLNFRSMEFLMLDRKIGVFVTFAGGGPAGNNTNPASGNALPPVEGDVLPAMSHSGVRALVLEHFLGKLPIRKDLKVDVTAYTGTYRSVPAREADRPAGRGVEVKDSGDGGLIIGNIGVYRPSGPAAFTLDGSLPLESGFNVGNRYVFVRDKSGTMRMFAHINAGGLQRAAAPSPN
jgi:CubicO group peptidase (beta-lactamase class C family)